MSFDFLADDHIHKLFPQHGWHTKGQHLKSQALAIRDMDAFIKRYGEPDKPDKPDKRGKLAQDIAKNPLAHLRTQYLREEFMAGLDSNQRGKAKVREAGGWAALAKTDMMANPKLSALPAGSALWTLRLQLLTPLLTRDDEPFHLFDNPLRKDHIFSVPYLSAAAIKGLAADAYQRAFPGDVAWDKRGQTDPERTMDFRNADPHAKRLFGVASDGDQAHSLRGRLHVGPLWLRYVQYLVLNPMDQQQGIGTQPIHFEAAAPFDDKGKPVALELRGFYFNPLGADGSDPATVRADLARLIAALGHWWPVMGLGAKRLAGYGAIKPLSAEVEASGWEKWPHKPSKTEGATAWQDMAANIAANIAGERP